MKITDTNTIDQFCNDAGEVQDGLFMFAHQGKFALDTAVYIADTEYYLVYEYEAKDGDPDLCNISHLNGGDIYGMYAQKSVTAYTTREEMMAHIAAWITAKNHF